MAVEYDANGTPILTNDSLISDVPPYTQAIAANGGTLVPSSLLVPAGALMPFAGQDAPDGWLLCHGQSLDVATYQVLWDAIGYRYGGSGASFNLPDLRGRVPAGQDNMGGTSANRLTSGQQGSPTWSNGGPGDLGQLVGLISTSFLSTKCRATTIISTRTPATVHFWEGIMEVLPQPWLSRLLLAAAVPLFT